MIGEGDETNKRQKEIPFRRFGDLYNATKGTYDEMKFCYFVLSFVRFGALINATKGTNDEMKFCYFVLLFVRFGASVFFNL